jgi:dihydroflavonol-4-reductase
MSSSSSSTADLILVTGAGGFIGMHVVDKFLKEGFRVRGTVRSLRDEAKLAPLRKMASADNKLLELVEIDLLDEPSKWQEVMKGVTIVVHVASPFPIAQPQDENELIKPAVEGTLKVFNAAFDEKVKRVVLTSSIVAVIGHVHEERSYSEADWADLATSQAYGKSKTLAEKAAWDFVDTKAKANEKCFELVVINPSFVLGKL